MGAKSSKRPKTSEPYNSFEALPTSNEFFNRQLLQQQQQQPIDQHQSMAHYQPNQMIFNIITRFAQVL